METRPFSRILIANRGEIALRIIRTCRRLGIETVALASSLERNAKHLAASDTWFELPGDDALAAYLNQNAIVEIAKRSGADAIHPGYGFLSENASFAELVRGAGIAFIGPTADSIRTLGEKRSARELATRIGVPTLAGLPVDADYHASASTLGFPLLVKAVAGGGGRGMRLVQSSAELESAIESARREAKDGFGDDRLILEKYLGGARHIEVQLLGDAHGNVFHLWERECTLQRRNQKVIEIAPAPALHSALRDRLHNDALKLAKAGGLTNAATAEFLVPAEEGMSESGHHYFLEVNCRLQVEHPVTEVITGLDLVELQIRSAAGENFELLAPILTRPSCGVGIEARIYAEDPARGFVPTEGQLWKVDFPEGDAIRLESALVPGTHVTTSFDPMLAKVIALGTDFHDAAERLRNYLSSIEIDGVGTNTSFLAWLLKRADSVNGLATTRSIEAWLPEFALWELRRMRSALAVGLALPFLPGPPSTDTSAFSVNDGFRSIPGLPRGHSQLQEPSQKFSISASGGEPYLISAWRRSVDSKRGLITVEVEVENEIIPVNWNFGSCRVGGIEAELRHTRKGVHTRRAARGSLEEFFLDGRTYRVEKWIESASEHGVADGSELIIRSPLPGKVSRYLVQAGERVKPGQPVLVLDSMKMEHFIESTVTATVGALEREPGSSVKSGDVLLRFES